MWPLVWSFLLLHILCVRTAKALVRVVLICLSYIVSLSLFHYITAGLEILTPDEYKYRVVGIDISDASSIVFEVKACNDAHILLMTNVDDEDNDIYEIVIGKSFKIVFF